MRGFRFLLPMVIAIAIVSCNNKINNNSDELVLERKVDSVLMLMTLEEKIGQLNMLSGHGEFTGPVTEGHSYIDAIKQGRLGAMLNVNGVAYTRRIQEMTLQESRLGIPMLFGYDIIHGYKTIFPVPLAEACSWDMEAIEKSARIAAIEASASGQQWTFAPMVDITRDPRWGRIMEGAGEDPYLGSLIAAARVRGFQGDDLSAPNTIAACVKHFAAYGAAEGGRDYNTTDMSERTLREIYLPPFKSAADAGVATFMVAFNEINGIPASANPMLKNILRNEWNYKGMIVSDWNSIDELILHGFASGKPEAAVKAMRSGVDMDMQGHVYAEVLSDMVKKGRIPVQQIDVAVRNVLRLKFQLGLFEDPYRYCNVTREKSSILTPEHRLAAREIARKSCVLLKNDNHLLPLPKTIRSVAIIGPLADDDENILGEWRALGRPQDAVSLLTGIKEAVSPQTKIFYEAGCNINDDDRSNFSRAVAAARKADAVIIVAGESADMTGEAYNRSDIGLPGVQLELIKEIQKTGKPVVLVLINGRPLAIPWEAQHVPSILEAWLPGTEAGHAVADILFGDYNPSGKLAVSFPRATGQIPVYYNYKNTGRPADPGRRYTSKYIDIPVGPLYPFGYGLSYTTFMYSHMELSSDTLAMSDSLEITIRVTNVGNYKGEEVVQLYIRDHVASVTRPVMELKDFRKVEIDSAESVRVRFILKPQQLAFYNENMQFIVEPGNFSVMVGTSSANFAAKDFTLVW